MTSLSSEMDAWLNRVASKIGLGSDEGEAVKAKAPPELPKEDQGNINYGKVAADHCTDCGEALEGRGGKIDRFERVISVEGEIDPELREKLVEIADKCPVHKTLETSSAVVTRVSD